ncbi:MAG TPA: hypothetical protein VNV44_09790 [Solirubrobacteraceae bacterium]|jgi:hypothetical protein|nr:hypothetical protein [Solirubrobacteraceae bacterium]HXB16019.1 hypothetical protein [Solirubrobacteraceae bacterium]
MSARAADEAPLAVEGTPPRSTSARMFRAAKPRPLTVSLATLLGYVLLSALIFGRKALGDIDHSVVGFGAHPAFYGRDQSAYVWFLAWGAHAVFHLQNPFVTHEVYAPGGYNLTWAASILGPAVVLAPLTQLWGPIVTYNLLAILAPAGAAWGAYLLCRDLTARASSAIAGGLLFGFGSYEAGVTINHLNLALVGLLPIAALLALRRARGRISRTRFILALGVVLGAQLWISTETFASAVFFGALAVIVALITGDRAQRRMAFRTGREAAAAVGVALALGVPYLWYALTTSSPLGEQTGVNAGADLANFVEPTRATWLHYGPAHFVPNVPEDLAYMGAALLVVLFLSFFECRKRRLVRFLALFMLAAAVLSLGGLLRLAGETTTLGLPWGVIGELPFITHALPGRFVVYVSLAAAVCVALWLDRPTSRPARWLAAAVVMVSLLPNLSGGLWATPVDRPPLLSSPALAHYVPKGSTVLALPFGINGNSMYWQVQADFAFRLAGGYVGWALPREYQGRSIIRELYGSPPRRELKKRLCAFIALTHTSVVILRTHTRGDWEAILRPLGVAPRTRGGFAVYSLHGSACARGRARS